MVPITSARSVAAMAISRQQPEADHGAARVALAAGLGQVAARHDPERVARLCSSRAIRFDISSTQSSR